MAADRGKKSEKVVKDWMTARSDAKADFAFHRHPDPHAGSLQPVPADYEAMQNREHHLIEVKEVKEAAASGSRRLPAKNFQSDKVGRMRKWQWAGSVCNVLVHHTSVGEWRLVPLDVFVGERPSSWDITHFPPYSSGPEALEDLFGKY